LPWEEVNYILNNHAGYTWEEEQVAIWTLIGETPPVSSSWTCDGSPVDQGHVNTLIASAALAVAGGWVPVAGNVIGVVMVLDSWLPTDTESPPSGGPDRGALPTHHMQRPDRRFCVV
jgi:hypothetical protein